MNTTIRMTEKQHSEIMAHLHAGDGKEAVAIVLCGQAQHQNKHVLLVHRIITVPYSVCSIRTKDRVTWSTAHLIDALDYASEKGLGVIKFHSHPAGCTRFSELDDISDQTLFPRIYDWISSDSCCAASVIVTPDGMMTGRTVSKSAEFSDIQSIWMVGSDITQLSTNSNIDSPIPTFGTRVAQTFGEKTFSSTRGLTVGVVGCSGTGSIVIEQLVRNGVGKLILVDPDIIKETNLNRISNSTIEDAIQRKPKVFMHQQAIESMGLGTSVKAYHDSIFDIEIVKALSSCDVIFGCVDSVDGRHLLNKLATYYLIPYFDVGVRLIADGVGGITQACGQSHYLQPGLSSLFSRGVYTLDQLHAASLFRTNPLEFKRQKSEGYISGVNIDKPAVISVNAMIASLATNDFLARLHPYRREPNGEIATVRISLSDMLLITEPESPPCEMLARHVGRGDISPLLNSPELSDVDKEAA